MIRFVPFPVIGGFLAGSGWLILLGGIGARSASVVAEAPLVAWRFSSERLEQLRAASSEAVIAFHRGMASLLADRLTSTNLLVRLLAD